jgi:UDP-N-acetylmuramate: L-alanyl-gamma-D-glutamyl-meso-diaminopimelate ligase
MSKSKIHFIAIGGAAMHNLALALQQNGYIVSGSDDEIMEPSYTRLKNAGLLPLKEGWYPEKIDSSLDGVILGMHARAENPELRKALELNIPVYSFPEFLYKHSKDKKRVVIGGSHGKTSITSMIMHVLKSAGLDFDYMVGAKVEGFETMVRLSNAPLIILEGDEYLSSPVDRRPKFHLFKADIGLVSGIAWDHINVFPTFENYVNQFRIFADQIPASGEFIYCNNDKEVRNIASSSTTKAKKTPYEIPPHEIVNGITFLLTDPGRIQLRVFGDHNLLNIEGARHVCNSLGINDKLFYESISSFKGAARRLELIAANGEVSVYRDFAHSPSKLKATIDAVKMQYPGKRLIACMELHTFSSLNENFLDQYKDTMSRADIPMVYFNPHTVEHKKLKAISPEIVRQSFGDKNVRVYNSSTEMMNDLQKFSSSSCVVLLMSSGTFDNMDIASFAKKITGNSSVAI